MTETTTKQVSQKADALARFTKGKEAGAIYAPHWDTFQTVRVELHEKSSDRMQSVANVLVKFSNSWPLFVRACPLHPRPGVLESTAVDNKEDLFLVISRITKQMLGPDPSPTPQYEHGLCDPDGCIIVQPFMDADASAVVSPYAHAVIGAGHDGVTAGSDSLQIIINLADATNNQPANALSTLGIDPSNIQLEFVSKLRDNLDTTMRGSVKDGFTFDKNCLVQLRGCPEGHMPIKAAPHPFTLSGSIVGGKVEVKHVIMVNDGGDEEMARLEQTLREMDDINGVVVAHPSGSQGSHHAGQCLAWGVSYVISDTPKVGDTWVEVDGWVIDDPTIEPQAFDHYHWREHFMQGLGVGLTKFTRQQGWLSNHFHQFLGSNVMSSPADTAYFAGVFAGFLPNAILSVSMGEMRHANHRKKNTLPIDKAIFAALNRGLPYAVWETGNRKHYYAQVEERPLTLKSLHGQLKWLTTMYDTGWYGGYGGTNYANSTRKAIGIMDALFTYTAKQNKDNFIALLGAVNEAENIVHNNGFFLNKFLDKRAFDIGTNHRIGSDETYLTSFKPDDFFAIYYAASHAYQHREMDDEDIGELTDTTELTTFALKEKGYTSQKNNPLFTRTDLPDVLLALADDAVAAQVSDILHPSESKYSHGSYFVSCGLEGCPKCIEMEAVHLDINLTLPLPDAVPQYDMSLPSNDTDDEDITPLTLGWEVDMDLDIFLIITLFKNNVYDDETLPTVGQFYNTVNKYKLYNSDNPLVTKALKHYANWMVNMPMASKNKLMKIVKGDE